MGQLTTDEVLNYRKKLEKVMGPYAYLMTREEIQRIIENVQEDPFMKPVKSVGASNSHEQQYMGSSRGSNIWAAKDAVIINDLKKAS